MTDKKDEVLNEEDEMVVVMTDDEGNEYYYQEEMIIPVNGSKFALLVGIHDDEEHEHEHCGCGCGCEDDDEDVIIAKIVVNADGEEEYVEPTDEEFDAVQAAYDAMLDSEEE